jgi:hypothetical protein
MALALAGALVTALVPAAAQAQACCVGTGLVTPARLRVFEDYGVGMQTRVRSVMGSFDSGGGYVGSRAGDDELDLGQDLFAAARFGNFQGALKIPFVETGRRETGVSAFGGGLGDVAANLRYDLTLAGDHPRWPGIAVLAGLSVPTGRTIEESADPTGATGLGSFEGNLGLAFEQVVGRTFVSLTGFVVQQTARTVAGMPVSYGTRLTALAAGGYAFASELTLGGFVLATRRRDEALVTAGAAVAIPLDDHWRVQGTLAGDLPFAGWGKNQLTGAGLTASILRVWM